MDFRAGIPLSELKTKYNLFHNSGSYYIAALVKVSNNFDKEKFGKFQIQVNTALGNIFSIHVPINHYEPFIGTSGIEYIELAKSVYPKLDKALVASKVHRVHQGENLSKPYSGKGVVIGIIDFGFDYTHPTFYDPEGELYRIKKVWEQNTIPGNPPSGFSYGQEWTDEQEILNAKTDLSLSGHGTHVASIAAGSGGTLENLYRGVAYESDMVLVSLNAGEGVSGNNTGVIDGINYIFQYAESVGKPAVVNISQGHHTGPHDGSSLTDQAIDAMSGPGRIIVGAVGNEGDASGFYLHFDHTFDDENNILSYLVWPEGLSAGITLVDIWGEVGTDFQVGIEIYNPKTKMLEALSEPFHSANPVSFLKGILVDMEGDTLHYEGGIEVNPLNNRPHAQLYIDNMAQSDGNDVDLINLLDNDFVQLRFQGDKETIHAYAANNFGEAFFTDLSGIGADEYIEGIRVIGGNPKSTMGELGGTARSIISVGGYTTKNTFINTGGQQVSFQDVIGDQYLRTSQGPTLDGRIKPEISAPANLIAASENSFYTDFDTLVEVNKLEKGDGSNWSFSIRRGTSAASPMVAGIVALMLEADPDLTTDDIKDILANHADQDNFTGVVPNNIWGHGKVNAYSAISNLEQPTSTNFTSTAEKIKIFPNPNQGNFSLDSEITGQIQISVLDFTGQSVFEKKLIKQGRTLTLHLPEHLNGIYILQFKQKEVMAQRKLILLD
jgi:subtilisin family serine protease